MTTTQLTREQLLAMLEPDPISDEAVLAELKQSGRTYGRKDTPERREAMDRQRAVWQQQDEDTHRHNTQVMNAWLWRGDGIAVYENRALDSANCGHHIQMSYGSAVAEIENSEPPEVMPDTGEFSTPWAYRLIGTYRGARL